MEEQAWTLRALLEELETEEAEDQEEPRGIAEQFARLRSQSTKYRTDKTLPTKSAEKSDNFKKNRYKDILPFDHSRVKLTFTTSKNDTDYINANFIKGVTGSRAYIATQGPLPHTVLDFLRMLWEYNIEVVVMACREFEMGKKKCECYWPKKQDEPYVCEPFTIYCDSEENKGDYITRTLRVNYRNCSRTMKQLHYMNWPDHGVPDSIPPILDMLQEMRSYQEHDDIPICIHCSAGCGRTGVLCVIDYTWNLLKKQMITPDFNIYDLVQNMRTQRPSVVQTKEQYVLVYRTIKLLFEKFLQSVDALEQSIESDTDDTVQPAMVHDDFERTDYDLDQEWKDMDLQMQGVLETNHSPALENSCSTETGNQQWPYSEDLQVTSFCTEIPESTSPHELSPKSHPVLDKTEATQEQTGDDVNLLQGPSAAAAVLLMVEDPYFDGPTEETSPVLDSGATPSLSLNDQPLEVFTFSDSGTLDAHSDEEVPPPLPERTPESFEVAENTESCVTLAVVIPPNAAAAAVRELRGGSPPSPVPPLPERTPESFELATDPAPAEEKSQSTAPVNLNLLGISSEWSGSSDTGVNHFETKSWTRSKSLRAKMTFPEFSQSKKTSNTNSKPSSHRRPDLPPPPPPGPPVHPLESGPTPHSQENIHGKSSSGPQPLQTAQPTHRVGISSEWDGATGSKKFLDVVMNRSKSVRVKGSSRDSLTVSQQQTPPLEALGATAQEKAEGHNPNASTEALDRGLSRSRSLKFFRSKPKPKVEPAASQPSVAPPSYESLSTTKFKLGFGIRFGKPKGPRTYPVTWV